MLRLSVLLKYAHQERQVSFGNGVGGGGRVRGMIRTAQLCVRQPTDWGPSELTHPSRRLPLKWIFFFIFRFRMRPLREGASGGFRGGGGAGAVHHERRTVL